MQRPELHRIDPDKARYRRRDVIAASRGEAPPRGSEIVERSAIGGGGKNSVSVSANGGRREPTRADAEIPVSLFSQRERTLADALGSPPEL